MDTIACLIRMRIMGSGCAPGFAPPSLERGRAVPDRGGELRAGGIGLGGGAAQRRERQSSFHLASALWQAGFRGGERRSGAGGRRAGRTAGDAAGHRRGFPTVHDGTSSVSAHSPVQVQTSLASGGADLGGRLSFPSRR